MLCIPIILPVSESWQMILHIIYHFNQDFIKVFTEWRVLHVEEFCFFVFFHADHFLKAFIEFVRLLLLFYVLVF